MASAIIEIDRSPVSLGPDVAAGGRRVPVVALALVVAGLLLTLTGPALVRPDYLPPTWRMAATTAEFWLTAGALYTIDIAGGIDLSARDPDTGLVRWSTPLSGPLAEVYRVGTSVLHSNFPPTSVDGLRTEVFNRIGGLARLSFPTAALPLVAIWDGHGGTDGVAVSIDRDPTAAPVGPRTGQAAARGLQWTHTVTARDLRTGAVRWTRILPPGLGWSLPGVRVGATGIVGLAGDLLTTSSIAGEVEQWDLGTGATRARRQFGRPGPEFYAAALADAVVVRAGADAVLDVLDPATLTRRSSFVTPVPAAEPVGCAPSVCLVTESSVVIVEPRTGATITRADGPLLRPGSTDRVVLAGYGNRLAVVDSRDGHAVPVSPSWRLIDIGGYTRQVVVAQPQSGLGARIALLDVATGQIRPVGQASGWSAANACGWAGDHVACADGQTLRGWRI